ncbi:TPA: hypothetical protein DIC38_02610 [Candidatus Nomurabacteria bacterium]|nr:MAG: hypothetical protein O210_OD1C00001G0029 [Parcubacteria bacterium RAAC4_OD1_1]HCY26544.1 hypothetical protein [Candidatus Nomurabacteria bacterium]
MKNKISIVITFVMVLLLVFVSSSIQAEEKNTKSGGLEIENQLKTELSNQGENTQLQVENKIELQVGTDVDSSIDVNVKGKSNLNDENESVGDEDESNKTDKDNSNNKDEEERKVKSEEHRSMVSIAVKEMLSVANRIGGIGEQVRVIAQNQVKAHQELEVKLESVQTRSNFSKFFIGPKYNEINDLKNLLTQNKEQIKELNKIKLEVSNESEQQILAEQISLLEKVNLEIESSLQAEAESFSLFGWVSKIFIKK